MEEAVKRAIEGGWDNPIQSVLDMGNEVDNISVVDDNITVVLWIKNKKESGVPTNELNQTTARRNIYKVLLDPLFWQAIGKAEEWVGYECPISEEHHFMTTEALCSECKSELQTKELYYWHRFIDHIAEGNDLDSFFKQLLSGNEK